MLLAVLGIPAIVGLLVYGPTAFDLVTHHGTPQRFLIPAGYTGWVHLDFRQAEAPPLPFEAGRRLLKIAPDGTLRTSSDPPTGFERQDFYYYSGEQRTRLANGRVCKGGMVWGMEITNHPPSGASLRFFVGPEK